MSIEAAIKRIFKNEKLKVNTLGQEMGQEAIPTSFNGCAKLLLAACGEAIEYTKEFFCVQCDVVIIKPDKSKKIRLINCLHFIILYLKFYSEPWDRLARGKVHNMYMKMHHIP